MPGRPGPPPARRPDVVVTDAVQVAADADEAVLVTLAALARSAGVEVPAGVVDEARELATHGDVFDASDEPDAQRPRPACGGRQHVFADLVPSAPGAPRRVHTGTTDTAAFLRLALAVWAADGSLVVTRGTPDASVLDARLAAEGVTASA